MVFATRVVNPCPKNLSCSASQLEIEIYRIMEDGLKEKNTGKVLVLGNWLKNECSVQRANERERV